MTSSADIDSTIPADTDPSAANDIKFVKIISAEGHSFFIPRDIACSGSTTMAAMLRGGEDDDGAEAYRFVEGREGVVRLPDIRCRIVEKICQYLMYKSQYSHSNERIPDFVIEPEISLELLLASNYLDC